MIITLTLNPAVDQTLWVKDMTMGQVNRFLKAFREQGGFERLGDSHLKEQKQAFKALNFPFFF